ncbi:UDP-N-acetylmuramate dehydrogenase [Salmonirosea aquatica]|uniref:UDP-N-acetylenolpyruvoylglucosamine reductase n=1 Tax=Salmonirosea aquatica TaxID=2654236 RepID=A0A7C9BGW7_9BACT|nr:UDP-N-acetylmuramate dehydrogenase [Cytophagaceae bacterium SJW1-29]
MEIQQNVSLRPYNTFGFDVRARYFVSITSVEQLQELLRDPQWEALPKWILGDGSNVLLTQDVNALVIQIAIKGIEQVREDTQHVWLRAGAGESWHQFVLYCVENEFAGVENLSLIPGTVGAAPMQNIGAYGVEIKDVFEELEAVEIATGTIQIFDGPACAFGYRESVFKRSMKDRYIITSVTLRLQKIPDFHVTYGDIQKTLEAMDIRELSLRAVSDAVIQIRQSKLPDPAQIGNAGSFFKNPEIPRAAFEVLKAQYPNLPGYPVNGEIVKVPAGWLIEQAGWKGHREGSVGVHDRQALVLVHYGTGAGQQIKALAYKIQNSVEDKFGIQLSPEVNFM